MIVTKHDTYSILQDEYNDITDFATYLDRKIPASYADENVVIDLLKYDTLNLDGLIAFLQVSNNHRAGKKSLVFVNAHIDYDVIPDEVIVVPTVIEAEDIIQMEEIERDLGF